MTYGAEEIERLREIYESCDRDVQATLTKAREEGIKAGYDIIRKYCEGRVRVKKLKDITEALEIKKAEKAKQEKLRKREESDEKKFQEIIEKAAKLKASRYGRSICD